MRWYLNVDWASFLHTVRLFADVVPCCLTDVNFHCLKYSAPKSKYIQELAIYIKNHCMETGHHIKIIINIFLPSYFRLLFIFKSCSLYKDITFLKPLSPFVLPTSHYYLSIGFHSGGCVDRVSKQAVPWHLDPHHPRHRGPAVYAWSMKSSNPIHI